MEQQNLYLQFYNNLAQPFRKRKRLVNALIFIEKTLVGVCAFAYLFTVIYAFSRLEITENTLLRLFGLPAACLLIVTLLRKLCKRPRPYERGVQPLVEKDGKANSFPSRHTACAFVIAATVLPYFPLFGGTLLAVGAWIAFFRFLFGHHYFSDLLVGAALGILFGVISWL